MTVVTVMANQDDQVDYDDQGDQVDKDGYDDKGTDIMMVIGMGGVTSTSGLLYTGLYLYNLDNQNS